MFCLYGLLICCVVVIDASKVYYIIPELPLKYTEAAPGSPWPQPQEVDSFGEVLAIRESRFQFDTSSIGQCELVDMAVKRYKQVIFDQRESADEPPDVLLNTVSLELEGDLGCEEYPTLDSDESYAIEIKADGDSKIKAEQVWGLLRGLETFSQLIYQYNDEGEYMINVTTITDFPRYKHRGFLLDTSRHFIPIPIILKHLDAMAYNKFNVFHWHLVDHQAFAFVSKTYPELSEKGAYHPELKVYKPDDVSRVIFYARLRGIRVIPEFDTPGHMESWGRSHPEIITMCYENGQPFGRLGTINPIKNESYRFVENLFREVIDVFQDEFVHLGADEVTYDCWASNPEIQEWMTDRGWDGDYSTLEEFYQTKLFQIITNLKAKYIIWQDPIDNNVTVNPDTIVQVWKDPSLDPILPPYREGLEKVTKLGLKTILSAPWYLNYISYGPDWKKFYETEPEDFQGTEEQKELLIGGEACMWAEYVDGGNIIARIWPRAAAVAERLWSAKDVRDIDMANVRLDQQRCRMVRRGINAEPIAPGYCGRYEYAMDDPWGSDQINASVINKQAKIITIVASIICLWKAML